MTTRGERQRETETDRNRYVGEIKQIDKMGGKRVKLQDRLEKYKMMTKLMLVVDKVKCIIIFKYF